LSNFSTKFLNVFFISPHILRKSLPYIVIRRTCMPNIVTGTMEGSEEERNGEIGEVCK
jgi:hypothetical protein